MMDLTPQEQGQIIARVLFRFVVRSMLVITAGLVGAMIVGEALTIMVYGFEFFQ